MHRFGRSRVSSVVTCIERLDSGYALSACEFAALCIRLIWRGKFGGYRYIRLLCTLRPTRFVYCLLSHLPFIAHGSECVGRWFAFGKYGSLSTRYASMTGRHAISSLLSTFYLSLDLANYSIVVSDGVQLPAVALPF